MNHLTVKQVFLEACRLSGDARGVFLDAACEGDDDLRREVESLLSFHDGEATEAAAGSSDAEPGPSAPTDAAAADSGRDRTPGPAADGSHGGASQAGGWTGSPDRTAVRPGQVFAGRYRVVAEVGRGGLGWVLRAHDLVLDQPVAVKILRAPSLGGLDRLIHEVRLARQVTHPNVCRVFDFGEADGLVFLTMEYVDGEDLGSLLRRIGRLPQEKLLDLAQQLCAGLGAAHAQGILHRDLKPANVMIDGRGQVRITDFGIATLVGGSSAAVAGTPAYMAPEAWHGQTSVQSDLYSLGLLLYEMATGRPVFAADTPAALAELHRSATPATTLPEQIDSRLEAVILRCLEKQPGQRPPSCLAVAAALPGADRLQRLVDAGQTPPPELVAEAGSAPTTGRGAPLLLSLLVTVLAILLAVGDRAFPGRRPWASRPPAANAERASEILRRLGHPDGPAHRAWGFRPAFHPSRPDELVFWYREAQDWMLPWAIDTFAVDARVSYYDPPPLSAGDVQMRLDSAARLLTLKVLTASFDLEPVEHGARGPPRLESPFDWTPVWRAVGRDGVTAEPAAPRVLPPTWADRRAAWTFADPLHDDQMWRLEAAAFKGRIVLVDVTPEDEAGERDEAPLAVLLDLSLWAGDILWLVLPAVAAVMARRNVRAGRSDLRGARRLAAAVVIARLAAWFLASDHAPAAPWLDLLAAGAGQSLVEAALAWLGYLALEPTVRRVWPRTLGAWSRLLRGPVRDAAIGRSLLVGAFAGGCWALAITLDRLAARALGLVGLEDLHLAQIELATSGRRFFAGILGSTVDAVYLAVFELFFLAVLRVVLRSPRAAIAVWVMCQGIFLTAQGFHPAVSWLFLGLGAGLTSALVLVRFGLLAYVVGIAVSEVLVTAPLTLDLASWLAPTGAWAVLVALTSGLIGLHLCQRDRASEQWPGGDATRTPRPPVASPTRG